jgi:hypothetical protein
LGEEASRMISLSDDGDDGDDALQPMDPVFI